MECVFCENGKITVSDVSDKLWSIKAPNGEAKQVKLNQKFEALKCQRCNEVFLNGNQAKELEMLLKRFV
jgi:hypothetical protein